jgi:tetratricopeptide (TPR) repeat protein
VAHHLSGQTALAVAQLDAFRKQFSVTTPQFVAELTMYRAQLLEESGDAEGAFALLDAAALCDVVGRAEFQGRLGLKLGKFERAMTEFRALLKRNPENYKYHCGVQLAGLEMAALSEAASPGVPKTLRLPCTRTSRCVAAGGARARRRAGGAGGDASYKYDKRAVSSRTGPAG